MPECSVEKASKKMSQGYPTGKLGSKITGDDCLWRVNIEELRRQEQHKRPVIQWRPTAKTLRRPLIVVGRNEPVRNTDDAPATAKDLKLLLPFNADANEALKKGIELRDDGEPRRSIKLGSTKWDIVKKAIS
jgi:hypothetical protein